MKKQSWKNNTWRVKPIRVHFNLDSDRDGILDHKDCKPFNPHKQHISENEEEKLRKVEKTYKLIEQHKKLKSSGDKGLSFMI